ncbi:MAG: hypothetical protein AAGF10_02675 [Verrucomicrobiota bacterium]
MQPLDPNEFSNNGSGDGEAANRRDLLKEIQKKYGLPTNESGADQPDKGSPDSSGLRGAELLRSISEEAILFTSNNGRAYASLVTRTGRRLTTLIRSETVEKWLRREYYVRAKKAQQDGHWNSKATLSPTQLMLEQMVKELEARALFEPDFPEKVDVWSRTAGRFDHRGRLTTIYVDLCNEQGEVIEITAKGWRVLSSAPEDILFLHNTARLPLPTPERGGALSDLLPVLNVATKTEQTFVLAWLIYAFHPSGTGGYPVLVINGPPGSGKTTLSALLRGLVDPVNAALRIPPQSDEDYAVMALNNRVVALENVSRLSVSQSNLLCCISTGSAFGRRQRYTDTEERAYQICRPILLNGIEEFAQRSDLLSRCLKVETQIIAPEKRSQRGDLERAMKAIRGKVLGGIMNALVACLSETASMDKKRRLPRLADFAAFVDRAHHLFPQGSPSIIEAFEVQQENIAAEKLDQTPLARTICKAMAQADGPIVKSATEMCAWINTYMEPPGLSPENIQQFRTEIRKVVPLLLHYGVKWERLGLESCTRRALYRLSLTKDWQGDPSDPSHPSRSPTASAQTHIAFPSGDGNVNGPSTSAEATLAINPTPPSSPSRSPQHGVKDAKDRKDASPQKEFMPGDKVKLPNGQLATVKRQYGKRTNVVIDGDSQGTFVDTHTLERAPS